METTPFDAKRYRASQQKEWDAVASGWRKWWPTMEATFGFVSERMIDVAGIAPGQSVLDVATGIGEPAATAAKRVGASGRVVAVDQAPQMLAIAKERAAELGLTQIRFVESDAETLGVDDGPFDAILCRFGLMFVPALPRAAARMRALMKPGGSLVAAVWGAPQKCPGIGLPMGILKKTLGLSDPPPGQPGVFALADPAPLIDALERAGFTDVETETASVAMRFDSPRHYVEFLTDIAGPIVSLLAGQGPESRAAILRDIETAAAKFVSGKRTEIEMPNEACYIVARAR